MNTVLVKVHLKLRVALLIKIEGSAVNKNSWSVVKLNPTLFKLTATALNNIQTQNASNKHGTEIHKLRFAMRCPVVCQN